ncbi:CoA-binding protein [Blastococcus saxobsidens]|uniref:Acyl-CoA synthetase (NDP forming) n=1 Tax=Blastococcus saxobsidens (strain DD2) TaxID=1146883 RepID=H6RNQ1_BLASD|nr:CoA-binding protein [Blastococcus saxobsidens]CCG05199.1 Acyl-CoA synthetase (NDP forming) [Blastococcus saxobsidens DD2]
MNRSDEQDVLANFAPLFTPRAVAVVGMSGTKVTPANTFARHLREFGFSGNMYAIHPREREIDGLPVYPSFADLPERADYAYIAVPGQALFDLLAGANGKLRFGQVMSSGFGEVAEGVELQRRLVEAARQAGVRIIGPNCLGTYSPRGRLSFVEGASAEPGSIGVVSQSGGLGVDILRRGKSRGLRFSGLVTVGNSADVDPAELLEFYLHDPETRTIGLYVEDVRNGRRLFELLRQATGRKPCVLLKGGRSSQGGRAAASHTGALVSDDRIWTALVQQTGLVQTDTLDEFLNALLILDRLTPNAGRVTENVVLFGNGGGTSVLATDAFSRQHFDVSPLSAEAIEALEALSLPPGTSVVNPIDTPAGTLSERDGEVARDILAAVTDKHTTDAVVVHINVAVIAHMTNRPDAILGNIEHGLAEAQENMRGKNHLVVVLRSDEDPSIEEFRRAMAERLRVLGVPVFREMPEAAVALGAMQRYERAVAELAQ